MADTEAENSGAAAEAGAAEGAGSSTENEGAEAAAEGTEDAGADDGDGSDAGADSTDDEDEADDGKEPETRKKPVDFIIARKNAKIAKLAGKNGNAAGGDAGDEGKGNEGADDGEDDDIADEDREVVIKSVMPIIEPLLKQNAAQENEKELQGFLSGNPDFKPYEAKIRRFMEHPTRAGIPVKAIAYEVAGDKLMQIGAKRAKAADEKARETQTGGGSSREGAGEKSVWDMTPEEFAAQQQKVRSGGK